MKARRIFKWLFVGLFVVSVLINVMALRALFRTPDESRHSLLFYDALTEPAVVNTGGVCVLIGNEKDVPPGWLPCAGQVLPAAEYPQLAEAIASRWGGSGETIHLPDMRGFCVFDFFHPDVLQHASSFDRWILTQIGKGRIGHLALGVLPKFAEQGDSSGARKELTFCVKL